MNISAVILAAGKSRRMGQSKINLPWGNTTVLGHIIKVLDEAGIDESVVVTGVSPVEFEQDNLGHPVRFIQNPQAAQSGMLTSLRVGLSELQPECGAALVTLGDQPQIEVHVVKALLRAYQSAVCPILVPSFQNRRGHPWLLGKNFWEEVNNLDQTKTMRDFLNLHAEEIVYVGVDTASILQDLDTPADYAKFQPS